MNGWSWKRTVNNENLEKNIAFGAGVLKQDKIHGRKTSIRFWHSALVVGVFKSISGCI